MPNIKNKLKKTSGKNALDHKEALLNVANFLGRYKKWYEKWQKAVGGIGTNDGGGTTPGGPPPPPPQP